MSDGPRILVVITRRIGDVLLATPVFRSLRRAMPEARIEALVFAGTEGVLEGNPDLDAVLTTSERAGVGERLALFARLWRRYDLALSLLPGDRPTLLAGCAGRRRAGMISARRKDAWKARLMHVRVPFDDLDTHTVRMNLRLVEALGIEPLPEVVVSWTDTDAGKVEEHLRPLRTARFAVLHPYPKFNYKMWRPDGWVALGHALHARGLRLVLTGGPGAEERRYVSGIAQALDAEALDLSGELSLAALGALISRAALYVGPDTMTTHMAAALGVPTVALFGPSNPVKWGPWPKGFDAKTNPWQMTGSQHVNNVWLIQGEAHCVPCMLEGCGRRVESFSDCLQQMPAQRVIAAAERALA